MEFVDLATLRSDLSTTAALLRALKRAVRTPGHRLTSYEGRTLATLKARATRLCALRAHLRGRVHLRGSTLDAQAAFVDEERQIYTRRRAA